MTSLIVTVANKRTEAEDIVSFELGAADGGTLPPFSAGSHIDVHLDGEKLIRQYSLCNDPTESHRYQIAVLRDPCSRGGSLAMHDRIVEGARIEISLPRNHFPLVVADETLLIAGGIGVTPLLCMAERLSKIGAPFRLHYCTRSQTRTAFWQRLKTAPFASQVSFHFDDGEASQFFDAASVLGPPRSGCHIYICGPSGFIDHVVGIAKKAGWPESSLHKEYFGAPEVSSVGDRAFSVQLASSGAILAVPPDKSVVEVLSEHGVALPLSCHQGVCGTCITRVLGGEIDHRDFFFTDAEHAAQDQFTPCCSRAHSDLLVLDL
jgi:vanillate O-demethylase ferredoxin subunit